MPNYTFVGTVKDGPADVGTISGTMSITDVVPPPIDTTKPVISSVTISPSSGAASSTRTIKIAASDTGGGVLKYTCKVGGQDATPTAKPNEFTAAPQATSPCTGTVEDEAGNSTSYTANIEVATTPPVTEGTIPVTWDDPIFAGNANQNSPTGLGKGQNMSRKTLQDQSGNASLGLSGDNIVDTVRINSREGMRVGGPGMFDIRNCYINTTGTADDHADGIQAYFPGARGTIKMRNSTIVSHNTSANAGLWVADNWTGTVDLKDVVFQGGPYGLRLHADSGGDITIIMENVFFVHPFLYRPFYFLDYAGHKVIIQKWTNVCNATIVNGALVPGTPIAKP